MASKGGSIKGFFRQKKSGGITKSKSSKPSPSKKTVSNQQPQPAAAAALISHVSLDLKGKVLTLKIYVVLSVNDEREDVLRQFDMNMAYGPCIGMTRLARWERADKLGLNPPRNVENFLKESKVGLECLWNGRI